MEEHPDRKEHLAKQLPPVGPVLLHLPADPSNDAHQVHDDDGGGGDDERGPPEDIQLRKLSVVVGVLLGERELRLEARQHLEQPLPYGHQMGTRSSNDPELRAQKPQVRTGDRVKGTKKTRFSGVYFRPLVGFPKSQQQHLTLDSRGRTGWLVVNKDICQIPSVLYS
jgi:hypothetical protein